MGEREDLLERVRAARRRRGEAEREMDEAQAALWAHDAAHADAHGDGAGDEVLHPPGLPRVTVRG